MNYAFAKNQFLNKLKELILDYECLTNHVVELGVCDVTDNEEDYRAWNGENLTPSERG